MFDLLLAISVSVDVSYTISEILDVGGWNDLKISFKVIKIGTNRKLVYAFLLVVYSNSCRITRSLWEIWCETVQWPWNMAKVIAVVSRESCRVAMYVKCSEDSERKKRKSPFSTTPLSFDTPSPANPRGYLHKPYTARNYVLWATFLSRQYMGICANARTVLSETPETPTH